MRSKTNILVFSFFSMLLAVNLSLASGRENTITGSLALEQGYDSNRDRTHDYHMEEWTTTLSPTFTLTSRGSSDSVLFSYTPGFRLKQTTDERETDHSLLLQAMKNFSPHLTMNFSERFFRSDDTLAYGEAIRPEGDAPAQDVDVELSRDRQRNRFWINTVSLGSTYEYAKESTATLSYTNTALENTSSSQEDYTRHNPRFALSHLFKPGWRGDVSYGYTKADFKPITSGTASDDFESHNPIFRVSHELPPDITIFGTYSFIHTDYQGTQVDYDVHSVSLGGEYSFDPHTSVTAEVGAASVARDGGSDDNGINYNLSFVKQLQRGEFTVEGSGGYDEMQLNGTQDGLARFWSFGSRLNYEILERLVGSVFASYRNDTFLEAVERKENRYDGGARLAYSFMQWYTLSLRYNYYRVEAERVADDYFDHRLFLQLSVGKDLWRW